MSICPTCNGTGIDNDKSNDLTRRGIIDFPAFVRCWACNGNGNDDPNGIYERKGNDNGRNG